MNDLFLDELEFTKVAYTRISENPAEWTKDIIEAFFTQFPYFSQSPVEVVWRQRDDSKGYAIGAIDIKEGIGMTVPVLVRARELYPFDIAIVNGSVMPLTNATIQMYLQSKGAFLKVVPKEVGDITYSMFNPSFSSEVTPSFQGNNSYSQKTAESVFDKIASTILQEDKDIFFESFVDDKLVNAYKKQNTSSFIVKVAKVTPAEINVTDLVRKKLPRDIHYIYKSGAYEYKGVFGNSKIYDPITLTLDAVAAEKFDAVKDSGETFTKIAGNISNQENKEYSVFHIENSDRNIVVFSDKSYTELPTTDKISLTKIASLPTCDLNVDDIRPGITGFFKLANNTISRPFKVDRVYIEKSKKYIEGFDGLRKVAYCEFKGIETPYTEFGTTYIPQQLPFIKLGNSIILDETNYTELLNSNSVTKLDTNAFRLEGRELNQYKLAFILKDELDEPSTMWHVLQCGGSKNDIEKISTLKVGASYRFNHSLNIPVGIEKLASVISNEYVPYCEKIKTLAKPLIKFAAVIPSLPTIDAVLSLNFANKHNLTDFIEAVPLFESTVHYLAKLLLQTRLGVNIVDEVALRKVMLGLVDILQYLQGISTVVSKGK